jgi:hypothetical protein
MSGDEHKGPPEAAEAELQNVINIFKTATHQIIGPNYWCLLLHNLMETIDHTHDFGKGLRNKSNESIKDFLQTSLKAMMDKKISGKDLSSNLRSIISDKLFSNIEDNIRAYVENEASFSWVNGIDDIEIDTDDSAIMTYDFILKKAGEGNFDAYVENVRKHAQIQIMKGNTDIKDDQKKIIGEFAIKWFHGDKGAAHAKFIFDANANVVGELLRDVENKDRGLPPSCVADSAITSFKEFLGPQTTEYVFPIDITADIKPECSIPVNGPLRISNRPVITLTDNVYTFTVWNDEFITAIYTLEKNPEPSNNLFHSTTVEPTDNMYKFQPENEYIWKYKLLFKGTSNFIDLSFNQYTTQSPSVNQLAEIFAEVCGGDYKHVYKHSNFKQLNLKSQLTPELRTYIKHLYDTYKYNIFMIIKILGDWGQIFATLYLRLNRPDYKYSVFVSPDPTAGLFNRLCGGATWNHANDRHRLYRCLITETPVHPAKQALYEIDCKIKQVLLDVCAFAINGDYSNRFVAIDPNPIKKAKQNDIKETQTIVTTILTKIKVKYEGITEAEEVMEEAEEAEAEAEAKEVMQQVPEKGEDRRKRKRNNNKNTLRNPIKPTIKFYLNKLKNNPSANTMNGFKSLNTLNHTEILELKTLEETPINAVTPDINDRIKELKTKVIQDLDKFQSVINGAVINAIKEVLPDITIPSWISIIKRYIMHWKTQLPHNFDSNIPILNYNTDDFKLLEGYNNRINPYTIGEPRFTVTNLTNMMDHINKHNSIVGRISDGLFIDKGIFYKEFSMKVRPDYLNGVQDDKYFYQELLLYHARIKYAAEIATGGTFTKIYGKKVRSLQYYDFIFIDYMVLSQLMAYYLYTDIGTLADATAAATASFTSSFLTMLNNVADIGRIITGLISKCEEKLRATDLKRILYNPKAAGEEKEQRYPNSLNDIHTLYKSIFSKDAFSEEDKLCIKSILYIVLPLTIQLLCNIYKEQNKFCAKYNYTYTEDQHASFTEHGKYSSITNYLFSKIDGIIDTNYTKILSYVYVNRDSIKIGVASNGKVVSKLLDTIDPTLSSFCTTINDQEKATNPFTKIYEIMTTFTEPLSTITYFKFLNHVTQVPKVLPEVAPDMARIAFHKTVADEPIEDDDPDADFFENDASYMKLSSLTYDMLYDIYKNAKSDQLKAANPFDLDGPHTCKAAFSNYLKTILVKENALNMAGGAQKSKKMNHTKKRHTYRKLRIRRSQHGGTLASNSPHNIHCAMLMRYIANAIRNFELFDEDVKQCTPETYKICLLNKILIYNIHHNISNFFNVIKNFLDPVESDEHDEEINKDTGLILSTYKLQDILQRSTYDDTYLDKLLIIRDYIREYDRKTTDARNIYIQEKVAEKMLKVIPESAMNNGHNKSAMAAPERAMQTDPLEENGLTTFTYATTYPSSVHDDATQPLDSTLESENTINETNTTNGNMESSPLVKRVPRATYPNISAKTSQNKYRSALSELSDNNTALSELSDNNVFGKSAAVAAQAAPRRGLRYGGARHKTRKHKKRTQKAKRRHRTRKHKTKH